MKEKPTIEELLKRGEKIEIKKVPPKEGPEINHRVPLNWKKHLYFNGRSWNRIGLD